MESNITISNEVSNKIFTDVLTINNYYSPTGLQLKNDVSLLLKNLSLLLSLSFTHSPQELVEVFNNILNEIHETGWQQLQTVGSSSQTLLRNAERYGAYLASIVNDTDEPVTLIRENISEFLYIRYMYISAYAYLDWYIHVCMYVHSFLWLC